MSSFSNAGKKKYVQIYSSNILRILMKNNQKFPRLTSNLILKFFVEKVKVSENCDKQRIGKSSNLALIIIIFFFVSFY